MSELKVFRMDEERFNEMLAAKSFQVKQLGFEDGLDRKIRQKIGSKKVVTYEDGEVGGIKVPAYKANVSYEDVYKEQNIPTRIVLFSALGKRTEGLIEKYIEEL